MVPELAICDGCGRTVIVLSWSPVYEDAGGQLGEVDVSHTLEICCKVDCPVCGTRIQNVAPTIEAERA